MDARTRTLFVLGVCYGTALLLAIAGMAWFVSGSRHAGWGFLAAAAVLAAAGGILGGQMAELRAQLAYLRGESKRLEERLEQQRTAVDILADGLEVGILICDDRANILYANLRAGEMFGFDNPRGKSILSVTLSYDLEQLVLDAGKYRNVQRAELHFSYPDEKVALAKAWSPEDGGERVFLSLYEITDLRRLERVRQDFVANVSHELRTPLTLIRLRAETLLDDDPVDPELAKRYLPEIIREVDRLTTISNDLLILSAAESEAPRRVPCDLAEIAARAVEDLRAKADVKKLSLTYEGPSALPLMANPTQLTQVLLNLVDNAINYTSEGSVTVRLAEAEGWATIRVEDTGIGIGSEHLRRIFERFYRVDKARSRSTGGTGLGLAIVKHIVESHGGKVSVESLLNRGSTFTVSIPITAPPAE